MQRMLFCLGLACLTQFPSPSAAQDWWVYFGTYTGSGSRGIYVSRLDPIRGRLTPPQLAAEVPHPSFLAVHPKEMFLYSVSELGDGKGRAGRVVAYATDRRTGKLRQLNEQSSGGDGPCHLALEPRGRSVFVANYSSGSVAVLPLDREGRVGVAKTVIAHTGSGAHPQRQRGPHAHQAIPSPDGAHVLVCDLGIDQVRVYRWQARTGELAPHDPSFMALPAGSGPRHLAFHPNGRWAYVLNELNSTLTVCRWNRRGGTLEALATVSTLPEGFDAANNTTAEVAVHPSGRFVYASNRGHDSLAMFAVDEQSEGVRLLGHVPTEGRTPRHFAIDPSGRWCLVENQDSDQVAVFRVEAGSGRLVFTGHVIRVPRPVCAVFVPMEGR
ncbi:MAG: lactonase family protein [Limisphaera sp.]|nr:lactonase family protein [Limisphaera sp.]